MTDEGTEPEPPRAIGSGGPQSRAQLLAAAVRLPRRPEALEVSLEALRGVGTKLAATAGELDIETVGDMVEHVPHTHRDRAAATPIAELMLGGEATVVAEVRTQGRLRPTRRRNLRIVEATLADESGSMKASWFNQAWLAERLVPGVRLLVNGRLDNRGFRVSAYELLGREEADPGPGGDSPLHARAAVPPGIHTTGLVPAHPATEGLRPQKLREWAWQALARACDVHEPLPAPIRFRRHLAGAADARLAAHFPETEAELAAARHRLAYEELFLHQAALAMRRGERDEGRPALPLEPPGELVRTWLASLPFEPTGDQRRALAEIDADLAAERPMQRLLMGEVGSGKTVVAVYAMLRALESGAQAVLMAPTETLANQHFATLERLLGGMPLPIGLLTGASGAASRKRTLGALATGELGLVVGTHALIEPDVGFARLALAVVDEQHRFGVRQRRALDAKGPGDVAPHALHMTATPIPRTLSLTAYGDLDTTTLRELPAGRQPIRTWVVGEEKRAGAYGFLREQVAAGRQAYVVCAARQRVGERPGPRRRRRSRTACSGGAVRAADRRPARADALGCQGGCRWPPLRRGRPTCWSRRASSRSASTWPTPASW